MSEDVEQKFQTWLRGRELGVHSVLYSDDPMRAAFLAGAESQRARIAALEAERDRLVEVVTGFVGLAKRYDRVLGAALADAQHLIEEARAITPKEESRG